MAKIGRYEAGAVINVALAVPAICYGAISIVEAVVRINRESPHWPADLPPLWASPLNLWILTSSVVIIVGGIAFAQRYRWGLIAMVIGTLLVVLLILRNILLYNQMSRQWAGEALTIGDLSITILISAWLYHGVLFWRLRSLPKVKRYFQTEK